MQDLTSSRLGDGIDGCLHVNVSIYYRNLTLAQVYAYTSPPTAWTPPSRVYLTKGANHEIASGGASDRHDCRRTPGNGRQCGSGPGRHVLHLGRHACCADGHHHL